MVTWKLHQGVSRTRKIIQIPGMVRTGVLMRPVSASLSLSEESGSKFASGHVGGVLDTGAFPCVILYHVPIFLFKVGKIRWSFIRNRLVCFGKVHEFSESTPHIVLFKGFPL